MQLRINNDVPSKDSETHFLQINKTCNKTSHGRKGEMMATHIIWKIYNTFENSVSPITVYDQKKT